MSGLRFAFLAAVAAATRDDFGGVDQFAQTTDCPEDGIFSGGTYCDTIVK
jgi:hypothetical protein